jgi:small subunit ribosomal protein S3|uniref:Small ribosomal subunit protein uS3c n=1 Tax=Pycnococcus provasolii TaxID=41880 RepID=C0JWV6_9CHLO|nr:ribosomal protein S3 [Pycnococcus provasolii]ACK36841.1 ribosomal protein S3 [Pycnococcus provasolii]
MGQKVNPFGFRLGYSQHHRSDWFASSQDYSKKLQEDLLVRKFLTREFPDTESGISAVYTRRKGQLLSLEIHTARPRVLLGSNQETQDPTNRVSGLVQVRRDLEKLFPQKIPLSLRLVEETQPDSNVALLAASLAHQLEKRVAFRRALKQTIKRAQTARGVLGVKVQISGRLNGAEIARSEWVREGRVPLHTLRAEVDYATHTARTLYGCLGIKVWLYKESQGLYQKQKTGMGQQRALDESNVSVTQADELDQARVTNPEDFNIPVLLPRPTLPKRVDATVSEETSA